MRPVHSARYGTTDEIVGTAVLLASDAASWTSLPTLLQPGWNTVLIDIRRLAELHDFDIHGVRRLKLQFVDSAGPEITVRFNLYRSAEITGIPAPGYSSGQAIAALEEVAGKTLPSQMGYEWNAMSYQEKKATGTAAVVFVFALVMVFLVLAAQYESWSLPFSVLLGTPFAVFGAFLGLFLARMGSESYVNNIFAQIGLIMLIGLAAKNAILIVEFARAGVRAGKAPMDAVLEAAKLRFRPILMTACAFILGVTPLITASGAGAEARKVMGMAVFSGMIVATLLGVVLIPVLFVMVEKFTGGKRHEGE